MVDALALAKITGLVARVYKALESRTTEQFIARRNEHAFEWSVEAGRLASDALKVATTAATDLEQFVERLTFRTESDEFQSILDNIREEAAREAIAERRRMLAHAGAACVNVDLTMAQIARVERTLRELDPDDVLALASFARVEDLSNLGTIPEVGDEFDALLGAGCLRVAPGDLGILDAPGKLELRVTRLGHLVLQVLLSYVAACSNNDRPDS